MCSGGGGGSAPAKVDPTPVQVTSANTGADQAEAIAKNKQRKRVKTNVSNDRGTLLGGSSDAASGISSIVSNLGGVKYCRTLKQIRELLPHPL